MAHFWTERRWRDGAVEYKLRLPLMRGEHRPTVLVTAGGKVYATAISGYSRTFDSVDAAKDFASRVPAEVSGFRRMEVD